jgi:hypothetical protein
MTRSQWFFCLGVLPVVLVFFSCNKLENNDKPIPVWENWEADSATLTVSIQTQDGNYIVGQFVNLALTQDSLNNGLFVRRTATDGTGHVLFNRLFPSLYYLNCFSNYQGQMTFGSGKIRLGEYEIRDTILILH